MANDDDERRRRAGRIASKETPADPPRAGRVSLVTDETDGGAPPPTPIASSPGKAFNADVVRSIHEGTTSTAEMLGFTETWLLRRKVDSATAHRAITDALERWASATNKNAGLKKAVQQYSGFKAWLEEMQRIEKGAASAALGALVTRTRSERRERTLPRLRKEAQLALKNDALIDHAEWNGILNHAKDALPDDEAEALALALEACRVETRKSDWSPPPAPPDRAAELAALRAQLAKERRIGADVSALEARKAALEQREREAAQRDREREEQWQRIKADAERERVENRQRLAEELESAKRGLAEQKHEEDSARELEDTVASIQGLAPRKAEPVGSSGIFGAAGLGILLGVPLALLVGATAGNSCSSESRMALAEARAPLAASASPETLRLACAPGPERERHKEQTAQALRTTMTSIRPPSAAASVATRAAPCLDGGKAEQR